MTQQIVELPLNNLAKRGALDVSGEPEAENDNNDLKVEIKWAPELAEPLGPVDWLCEGLKLTCGSPSIGAGNAFSGKSAFAMDVAISVATGGDALGVFPCRKGRALYIDYDGQGDRITRERWQRMARGRGFSSLGTLGTSLGYIRAPRLHLDEEGAEQALMRIVAGIDLAVIDSWRGATPHTDEWRRGPVQLVGETLTRVSEATGCTILVIDHSIKPSRDGENGRSQMHDMHGSTAKAEMAQAHYAFVADETSGTISVRQTKERVSGIRIDPFVFRLEDLESGGDPRWGLRLAVRNEEQVEAKQRARDATTLERDMEKLRGILRANPGVAGRKALQQVASMRAQNFSAAYAKLTPEIVNRGTYHDPSLWLL